MAQVKLTRRGKRVVRGALGVSILVVIGAGFSAVSTAAASSHRATHSVSSTAGYMQVTVAPGETLWSIASFVAGNGDVSVVVDKIVEANALTSSDITVGQRLWVPTR